MGNKSKKTPDFLTISTEDFVKLVNIRTEKRNGLRRPGSALKRHKEGHKK